MIVMGLTFKIHTLTWTTPTNISIPSQPLICYQLFLDISTTIGNHVCDHYHQSQVVYPPNFCEVLFTTAAMDNIDHNPSSTTATDALHGTGISLFQHLNTYGGHEHGNTIFWHRNRHPRNCQTFHSPMLLCVP